MKSVYLLYHELEGHLHLLACLRRDLQVVHPHLPCVGHGLVEKYLSVFGIFFVAQKCHDDPIVAIIRKNFTPRGLEVLEATPVGQVKDDEGAHCSLVEYGGYRLELFLA